MMNTPAMNSKIINTDTSNNGRTSGNSIITAFQPSGPLFPTTQQQNNLFFNPSQFDGGVNNNDNHNQQPSSTSSQTRRLGSNTSFGSTTHHHQKLNGSMTSSTGSLSPMLPATTRLQKVVEEKELLPQQQQPLVVPQSERYQLRTLSTYQEGLAACHLIAGSFYKDEPHSILSGSTYQEEFTYYSGMIPSILRGGERDGTTCSTIIMEQIPIGNNNNNNNNNKTSSLSSSSAFTLNNKTQKQTQYVTSINPTTGQEVIEKCVGVILAVPADLFEAGPQGPALTRGAPCLKQLHAMGEPYLLVKDPRRQMLLVACAIDPNLRFSNSKSNNNKSWMARMVHLVIESCQKANYWSTLSEAGSAKACGGYVGVAPLTKIRSTLTFYDFHVGNNSNTTTTNIPQQLNFDSPPPGRFGNNLTPYQQSYLPYEFTLLETLIPNAPHVAMLGLTNIAYTPTLQANPDFSIVLKERSAREKQGKLQYKKYQQLKEQINNNATTQITTSNPLSSSSSSRKSMSGSFLPISFGSNNHNNKITAKL